jgi:hypothetical protein
LGILFFPQAPTAKMTTWTSTTGHGGSHNILSWASFGTGFLVSLLANVLLPPPWCHVDLETSTRRRILLHNNFGSSVRFPIFLLKPRPEVACSNMNLFILPGEHVTFSSHGTNNSVDPDNVLWESNIFDNIDVFVLIYLLCSQVQSDMNFWRSDSCFSYRL